MAKLPARKKLDSFGESATSRAVMRQSQMDKSPTGSSSRNHAPQASRSAGGVQGQTLLPKFGQKPKGKGKARPNPRKSPKRPSTPK